jgi:hypothetical protein
MSVLSCDRAGCINIMCDRMLFHCSKYICNDCYEELVKFKDSWPATTVPDDVYGLIEGFMETRPGRYSFIAGQEEVEEQFKSLTGYKRDGYSGEWSHG